MGDEVTTRLCKLAELYGSDKVVSIFHNYTPFYDEMLKDRKVERVLEIGIGSPNSMNHVKGYQAGASLRMWQDYFPSAEIWGLDNDRSVLINEGNIHSLECDQGSTDHLVRTCDLLKTVMGGKFDLIIDDGSHNLQHQALTANVLIPKLLSPFGIYFIEDVMYRRELYSMLPFPVEVRIFNLKRTWDDCLFFVEGWKL